MAKNIFAGIANSKIFELARNYDANFKSLSSKVTASRLDDGWEANKSLDPSIVNEWFKVTMRMILEKVSISEAKNPLEGYGIVENYYDEFGNIAQRIAVNGMKPVDPKFHGLIDGQSIDHYIVRKPDVKERFFTQNFDFQNFFTLQDFQIRQILTSEFGMDQITSGIMAQMDNSYTEQRYVNELEALNAGINSTDFPLNDTQKVELASWTDGAETNAEMTALLETIQNVAYDMSLSPRTGAYNAGKFSSAINLDDMVLLVRPQLLTMIQKRLMPGTYHDDKLDLPVEIKPVLHFGGLQPYAKGVDPSDPDDDVLLQPVYDSLGSVVGYIDASVTINGAAFESGGVWYVNVTSGGTTADTTFPAEPDYWLDPNSDVLAILVQKGAIFTTQQNEVRMIPTPINARGVYTNYFFNVINAGVHFDYNYNVVLFLKPSAT